MAFCTKCGAQVPEGTAFCQSCGAPMQAAQQQAAPAPAPIPAPAPQPAYDPFDHTAEFDAKDISENKVIAMATYLLGAFGIIIALLASRDSKYAAFHVRQSLKLQITLIICAFANIIPFLGWLAFIVASGIIAVLEIIAFFQVASGKAKEPAIIRNLGFLK